MKHLIILMGFLLVGLCGKAQASEPYDYSYGDSIVSNELSSSDKREIKKSKDAVKKQCIKLDTIIDQLKIHNISTQELIEKLRAKIEAKK